MSRYLALLMQSEDWLDTKSRPRPKSQNRPPATLDEALAQRIEGTTSPATLAGIVRRNWANPYFGAVPYLDAMSSMESFIEMYGADDGSSIGLYFLSNASTWKGPVAKAVKARIKELLRVRGI